LKPQKRIHWTRFFYESGWVQSSSVSIHSVLLRLLSSWFCGSLLNLVLFGFMVTRLH